jgi:hypothetical protein
MADANAVLAKLRDLSPEGAAARLAGLIVEDALGRTLGEVLDVKFAAGAAREVLRAFAASDAAAARVTDWIEEWERTLAAEKRPIGALVPASLKTGAHDFAALPVTPPADVIEKLLDREPLKKLLRAQVVDTLIAFGRKAASPVADSPIARGLGGLSKFALGPSSKPSALGAIANAVSGEVERQVEKRASDFADTAVKGILDGISAQLSDPARAKDQAAMRLALLDGFLELTGAEVVQLGHGPVAARVAVGRKALAAWVEDASFEADAEALVNAVAGKDLARTLGEILADLGVKEVVTAKAKEAVARRIAVLVGGDAFAAWLDDLLG